MNYGFKFGFLGSVGFNFEPGTVPIVKRSTISGDGSTIAITFDRPMSMTTDAHLALSAIKNGGTVIQATGAVLLSTNIIGIKFPVGTFESTDTITWSYNDQHATAEIKGAETGGVEIDNQTYNVVNNIPHTIHYKTPPVRVNDYWELKDIGYDPKVDGILHSANHAACTEIEDVELPIVYDLGSETIADNIKMGVYPATTIEDLGGGSYRIVNTSGSFNIEFRLKDSSLRNKKCLVSFNAVVESGSVEITQMYVNEWEDLPHTITIVDGHNEFVFTGRGNMDTVRLGNTIDTVCSIVVSDISVKEVTIPDNSYATRYDVATKQFIQVANEHNRDATTVENIVNGDFSDGINSWTSGSGAVLTIENGIGKMSITNDNLGYMVNDGEYILGKRYFLVIEKDADDSGNVDVLWYGKNEGLYEVYSSEDLVKHIPFTALRNLVAFGPIGKGNTTVENGYIYIKKISVKEILSVSATYKMTTAFSQYFTHTKALSQADLDALNVNPNLLADVWFNGVVLPSGFSRSDMVNYVPANEGIGSYLQDLSLGANIPESDIEGILLGAGNSISVSGRTASIHCETQVEDTRPAVRLYNVDKNEIYNTTFTLTVTSGKAVVRTIIGDERWFPVNEEVLDVGTYTYNHIGYSSSTNTINMYFNGELEYNFDATVEVSCVKISDYEIQNYTDAVRDTYKNVEYGVQNFFLEQDTSGRMTNSHGIHQLIGSSDNRFIEIDGQTQLVTKHCVSELYGNIIGSMIEKECPPPRVLSSTIGHDGYGIVVTFDRDMSATRDARDAINVMVDGVAKKPFRVLVDPIDQSRVGLEFTFAEFNPSEVVTWSYDDTHATAKITSIGVEINTDTHKVSNNSNSIIVDPEGAQVTHTGETVNVFLTDIAYGEFTPSAWVVNSDRTLHTVTSIASGAGIISLAVTPRIEQADTNITVSHVKQADNNVNSFNDEPAVNAAIDELFIRVPDSISMSGDEVASYTKLDDFGFELAVTTPGIVNDKPLLNCDTVSKDPAWYALEFDATLNGGDPIITKIYDGSTHIVNYTIHDGLNILAGESTGTSSLLSLYFDGTKEFDSKLEHFTLFKFDDATPQVGEKLVMTIGENTAINVRGYSASLAMGSLDPLFIEDYLVHDLFVRDDGTKKFIQMTLDRPIPEVDYVEIKYNGKKVNLYVNSVISNTLFYAVGPNVDAMYDLIYALSIPSDVKITIKIVRK